MVYFGQIESEWLELLLEKTEQARHHVERYFGLDRHLYFTYTHLVCRTALPGNFHLMHRRASGPFRRRNRVTPIHLVRLVSNGDQSIVELNNLPNETTEDNPYSPSI